MNITQFALTKANIGDFLKQVNWVLVNNNVSPTDRTPATQLMLAEIFGNAVDLPAARDQTQVFFRTSVLPQLQVLVSQVAEVAGINVDQVIKQTYTVYEQRCAVAYPNGNAFRATIASYAENFDVAHARIIGDYPDLHHSYWAVIDAFSTKN